MPQRIMPTDRPSREVRSRQATIAAVDPDDARRYFVTFATGGTAEPARWSGNTVLTLGQSVTVEVAPELHMWRIINVLGAGVVATKIFVFYVAGALVVGTVPLVLYSPQPLTIVNVHAAVSDTVPTDDDLIIDLNINGATIFTDQDNRPTILDGEFSDLESIPDVTELLLDDILTMDIDQVGSTIAGANLTVQVRCVEA